MFSCYFYDYSIFRMFSTQFSSFRLCFLTINFCALFGLVSALMMMLKRTWRHGYRTIIVKTEILLNIQYIHILYYYVLYCIQFTMVLIQFYEYSCSCFALFPNIFGRVHFKFEKWYRNLCDMDDSSIYVQVISDLCRCACGFPFIAKYKSIWWMYDSFFHYCAFEGSLLFKNDSLLC